MPANIASRYGRRFAGPALAVANDGGSDLSRPATYDSEAWDGVFPLPLEHDAAPASATYDSGAWDGVFPLPPSTPTRHAIAYRRRPIHRKPGRRTGSPG